MQTAILLKVREGERVTIGRNTTEVPANKIQINSQFISSRHCQLVPEEGRLLLTDSSRNGTWVTCTSAPSPDSTASTLSPHIKSIKSIHNTTVSLEPNTYIVFLPPTICKVLTEIVGLHFTGFDLTREFYHLECIKLNSLLDNRHLMTFFHHLGFGKDNRNGLNNGSLAQLPRKRSYPKSERIVEIKSDGVTDCEHEGREFVKSSPEASPPPKSAKIQATLSKEGSLENCMKCFKEFPIAELIQHSEDCMGDILRHEDEERFKHFIPSALDLDAISCSALNDTQHKAVDYVLRKSKESSDKIYPFLKCRVRHLGYKNADLDKTLHWIRYEAPIIIHLNLDRALSFLVNDTHYRNRFETGTSGGCLDMSARSSWEDRIFDGCYHKSPPVDRVKYGVLNIVGDSCGVKACYGYGDSFLQLKKVRLRTTFASADTSMSTVKLSCCEHYVNVMNEYSESELKAILDVATRRVPFHDSSVISTYKEVQIHGPVSLSENVECIVVNQRHRDDTHINQLLDKFIAVNKCNLIWMDQV